MDPNSLSEILGSLGLAVGLAACAGLRAWLPLLLTGLLARAGLLTLGPSFQFLQGNRALVLFGLATAIEILGDKIPAVDHALDVVSTVLRPAAATLLAASVMGFVSDPLAALALGLVVGAPTALVPHAAKAGLRATSTALTAGLANPVLSLLEDAAALVLFVLAVVVPLLAAMAVVILVIFAARRLRRRALGPA